MRVVRDQAHRHVEAARRSEEGYRLRGLQHAPHELRVLGDLHVLARVQVVRDRLVRGRASHPAAPGATMALFWYALTAM